MLQGNSIFSVSSYEVGSKLFVLSEKGLNLRESPQANGKKVTLVPYANQVEILEISKANPYVSEGIQGHWIKVSHKKFTGYVFDGYLSHFRPPKPGCKNFKEYLEFNFGKGKEGPVSAGDYEGRNAISYKPNILYLTEGGDPFSLFFPGISKEELFLVGKLCKQVESASFKLDTEGAFSEGFRIYLQNRIYSDENGVSIFHRDL